MNDSLLRRDAVHVAALNLGPFVFPDHSYTFFYAFMMFAKYIVYYSIFNVKKNRKSERLYHLEKELW